MERKEIKTLNCPFCGAPHSEVIPVGNLQVKCKYCGGIILVPPWMGGETRRCSNHPERLANGLCNDCGNSFCESCLNIFQLEGHARVMLYLCPDCLRRRNVERANIAILVGFSTIIFAIALGFVHIFLSVVCGIVGAGIALYGYMQKIEIPESLTVEKRRLEKEKRKAELESLEGIDAEETYSELITYYVNKWGVSSGIGLLEDEITAYIRNGESFLAAIMKIYKRHKEHLRKTHV